MPCCFLVTSTMSRHIQKNETRNKNRSFHMKRKKISFIKTRRKKRSSHLGKKSLIQNTNGGWVVGEGAVSLSDRGDGAVAGVGHGVIEVADGLVGEFMLRIPFVFLGDALLPVDVPLLQVCPDVGYQRPAVVDVSAGLGGVGVERVASWCFACQRSWSMSPKAVGGWSSSV